MKFSLCGLGQRPEWLIEMISFIVPAYNAEKCIERCLESIISQAFSFEYEVLVVDDGSKDNTKSIVCEMARRDSHIRYYEKSNGGVSSTRNYGLQKCSGEYVIFLDADDYLAQNYFEYLTDYEHFDLTIYGYYYKLTNNMVPVLDPAQRDSYDDVKQCFIHMYRANLFNPVWNKIYKRDLITALFDESLVMGEDLLFNVHYYKNVRQVRVINEPLYYYCVNENSVTQKYNPSYISNFISTRNVLVELKDHLGIDSYPDIDIALLDNIAGTIRLLVFNKGYRYTIEELGNIYNELADVHIREKSKSALHNVIYTLFKKRMFTLIFLVYRIIRVLKNILGRNQGV